MKIRYDPKVGEVVPDRKVLNYLRKNKDRDITVGSELLITAARLLHANGEILVEHFLFEDKILVPTLKGELNEWPKGFCDQWEEILYGLIDVQGRK